MFFKYQFYLLQLANYNLLDYWRAGWPALWQKTPRGWRKKLIWTLKMKTIAVLTVGLWFLTAILGFCLWGFWFLIIWFATLRFFIILFLSLAIILLWPIDWFLKHHLIKKAVKKIRSFQHLKIIAITGSYGKTTLKEMLAAVLSVKYRVLKTPENINTPVGIARLILNDLDETAEIFIVEMGAYHRGDIRALCRLTPPAISILTGINESHLARFGDLKNTVAAKFEIIEALKPDGMVILNADNDLILNNYQKYLQGRQAFFYTANQNSLALYQVKNREFDSETGYQRFELVKNGEKEKIKTNFLGEYIAGDIMACFIIGQKLGLTVNEIKVGITLARPIEHRLKPFLAPNGAVIIDDSYNGNPAGVEEAIKALNRFQRRRRIYFTPGLVEIGSQTGPIHEKIGRQLADVADLVILIKNSVTPFIAAGLIKNNFPEDKIIWFKKMSEIKDWLAKNLEPQDVILFQNDWPENYK